MDLPPEIATDRARLLEWLEPFASPARCGCHRKPWVVVRREDRLELRLSGNEARFSSYAEFREGYVCAGAATENLHLALSHAGFDGAVELLPDRADPSLLAVLRPVNRHKPSAEDEALFTFLSRPFQITPVGRRRGTIAPALLALLRHVARQHGAWLDVIADAGRRQRLEALLGEAMRSPMEACGTVSNIAQQLLNHAPDADEESWFTSLIGSLGSAVSAPSDPPTGESKPDVAARVMGAPVLLILGTSGDRPLDWLIAGQALQHVLLHASSQGLSTTFLNEPLRQAPLRDRIRAIAGHGEPQVIARLDFGDAGGARQYIPAIFPVH